MGARLERRHPRAHSRQKDVADISTDLLLRFTLQRRGPAYDVADMMSVEAHQKIDDMRLVK